MPGLSTNTYILELCVSSLHRGHAKCFKTLTCHQNRGHATLLPKKTVCTCHPCTKGHAIFLCARKNAAHSMWKREIVIPAKDLQYSADDFSVIFALLGEQSRVPTFRSSQKLWAASQAVDEGGDTSGVCSTPSIIVSRLRARALALDFGLWHLLSSLRHEESIPRRKSPAICRLHSVRQTLYFPRICVRSLDASRSRGLLGRGRTSSLLSAAAVLLPDREKTPISVDTQLPTQLALTEGDPCTLAG